MPASGSDPDLELLTQRLVAAAAGLSHEQQAADVPPRPMYCGRHAMHLLGSQSALALLQLGQHMLVEGPLRASLRLRP